MLSYKFIQQNALEFSPSFLTKFLIDFIRKITKGVIIISFTKKKNIYFDLISPGRVR